MFLGRVELQYYILYEGRFIASSHFGNSSRSRFVSNVFRGEFCRVHDNYFSFYSYSASYFRFLYKVSRVYDEGGHRYVSYVFRGGSYRVFQYFRDFFRSRGLYSFYGCVQRGFVTVRRYATSASGGETLFCFPKVVGRVFCFLIYATLGAYVFRLFRWKCWFRFGPPCRFLPT